MSGNTDVNDVLSLLRSEVIKDHVHGVESHQFTSEHINGVVQYE